MSNPSPAPSRLEEVIRQDADEELSYYEILPGLVKGGNYVYLSEKKSFILQGRRWWRWE
jgi:hypothetical protein